MTDTPTERGVQGAWDRLRRRKVVQWGLAYAAGAWALAQGLAHLVGTFHWPEQVQQFGTLLLLTGLPIALVVAWFHGDRGEQRVGRAELVILAVLFSMAGGLTWWVGSRPTAVESLSEPVTTPAQHTPPAEAPSVAVLPFVNLSSDPEQEYFSDGLSEEILNALARIPGLYVPARTSSFQFKNQTGDVAKFASQLGVTTVLEGSVRRSGDRVRITAQLISAEDGYHLWSETYDRELKDIFQVQDEIAGAIVNALQLRLSAADRVAAAQAPPTSSLDAYQAFMLGRYEQRRYQLPSLATAIEQFRRAIALDPGFADAHANLALALLQEKTHPNAPFIGRKPLDDYLAETALPHLAMALQLGPGRSDVLGAAGKFAVYAGDHERALEYYDKALAASPNDGDLLSIRAGLLHRMHKFDRALEASFEAAKRDPVSWPVLNALALRLLLYDRRSDVDAVVQRMISLNEVQGRGILTVVASYDGDRAEAVRQILTVYDLLVAQSGDVGFGWRGAVAIKFAGLGLRDETFNVVDAWLAHLYWGEYSKAIPALEALNRGADSYRGYYGLVLADALYGATRYEEALAAYRAYFAVDKFPNVDALLMAADAARRSGAIDLAGGYRSRAGTILESALAAGVSPRALAFSQAMLHAYDGRDDEAAAWLVRSLDTWHTFMWPYHPLQHRLPLVARLTERQAFQEALRKRQVVIDRQRAAVIEMLCGQDRVSRHYKPAPATCVQSPSRDR